MTSIAAPDRNTARAVIVVATLSSFLTPFMGSAVTVALPSIARDLSLHAILLSWVTFSYLLAAAVFLVPMGRIADILGTKRILRVGIAVFVLSSFGAGVARNALELIGFRVIQGIGSAMIYSTAIALLIMVFPVRQRGRILGINVAATYLGLSLGPFLGGILTQYLGWRTVFFSAGAFSLVPLFYLLARLPGESADAPREPFDLHGSLVYGLSLVSLMIGFSRLPGFFGTVLILGGLVGLYGFARIEKRIAYPVLNVSLFRRNRVFAFSNLAALIHYSATFAIPFLLSLYLQNLKGLDPGVTGVILLAQPLMQASFSPVFGRMADRLEPQTLASLGMGITTCGLFLFAFLTIQSSLVLVAANLALIGFGFALFSSPNTYAVMGAVEKKYYGVASATLATMRLTGQMFSMGTIMLLFAVFLGKIKITPQQSHAYIGTMRIAFAVFAVFCLTGIFASLSRGKIR
jgi:MFS family permease